MSIYSTGAQALRDTTKWLVAFVPIATIVGAIAVFGPRLAGSVTTSGSLVEWGRDNLWPLLGVVAALAGVVVIVTFGSRVLSTQPKDFVKLLSTDAEKAEQCVQRRRRRALLPDSIRPSRTPWRNCKSRGMIRVPLVTPSSTRTVAATEALREWVLQNELARSFRTFRNWFRIRSTIDCGGLCCHDHNPRPTTRGHQPTQGGPGHG